MEKRRVFFILLISFLVSVYSVNAANCGGATSCNCADTLTSSWTMSNSLTGCTADGVNIGAHNLVLDCNGFNIVGDSTLADFGAGIVIDDFGIDNALGYDNITIRNCNITGFGMGIHLKNADNGTIHNNSISYNVHNGINSVFSVNNPITNNTINSNIVGIFLHAGGRSPAVLNNIADNIFSNNVNSIFDNYISNNYTNNQFLSEVNIMFNPEDNRTLFPNQETIFDVYIIYPNETAINTYTVNSVETDPNETVSYSTSGNKITINFTASRQGLYSIVLNVTDNKNNIIKQRFYLGNQSTLNYYFRPGQYPSHGQPSTYGEDSKAIKFEAPTSGENFCTCAIWVQLAIDNISESITGISRIVNVNMSFWYNLTTDDRNYVGFQKHATWSELADYGKSISNTTQYEWTNERINLGYWIYNRTEWYWLSFKLGGDDPFLKTNVSNPSYLNLTYLFTSDPEIKNITNNNINLLSSTSTVGDSRYASIVLDGTGTTNITVQMSNNATTYSATYDGINCNTANCTFTQSEGQLDFVLTLGSEHTISISPVIPVVHTPSSSIPNPQQVFRGEDKNYTLNSNGRIRLILNGQTHNIYVKKIDKNYVDFEIYSEKIELRLYIGDKEDIDIDFDGEKEITITLEKIEGREATISIETYSPEIKVEVEKEVTEEEVKEQDNEREEINNEIPLNKALVPAIGLIIIIIIGLILTVIIKIVAFKKRKHIKKQHGIRTRAKKSSRKNKKRET